jgi:uncharacterized repeat protein (TIGR01451 family)
MRPPVRRLALALLLAGLLCALPGCFGGSQNPSYFPYLLPTGDIIQTHAKPTGNGYYANFDPHDVRLEVRPNAVVTNPVRTQHVIVATVYDENNVPRRERRVEWMVEGVGNILEVDESGCQPGRGYKVDGKYAVSYTNFHEHRMTRGNAAPGDDFVLRPGQTWCVVSAAVEGDTHVTVYAPGIYDWEKRKQTVTLRWVDAGWLFPSPAAVPAGGNHVLTTKVFRPTDQLPLSGYRVRYKLLDGPPARFAHVVATAEDPAAGDEVVVRSDDRGLASATLAQLGPRAGVSRVGIEVIRPPDPTAPSGVGIVLASTETTVEWLAPGVSLSIAGPPAAAVGQDVRYAIAVSNSGKVESRSMTVTSPVTPGLQFVRSDPPAVVTPDKLIWTLGRLPPGQTHAIQADYKTVQAGTLVNRAAVVTEEGIRDEKFATTVVGQPGLRVLLAAPGTGAIGVPVNYQIRVSNPGVMPASNVVLEVSLPQGLELNVPGLSATLKKVNLKLGTIPPNETVSAQPLTLIPRVVDKLTTVARVTADGGLSDQAEHTLTAVQPKLGLDLTGPKQQYVSVTRDWVISVSNPSAAAAEGVVLRYQVPPEMSLQSAAPAGQLDNGTVVWKVAPVPPQGKAEIRLRLRGDKVSPAVLHTVTAQADGGLTVNAQATVELTGVPALQLKMEQVGGPVAVGKRVAYQVAVTNTGSQAAGQVAVKVVLPPELAPVATAMTGPTKATVAGQDVVFAPLAALAPQQTAQFRIEAEATRPGDVRTAVEVNSTALTAGPVSETEATTITAAPAGAAATPQPTPQGIPAPWQPPTKMPVGPKS